MIKAIDVGRPSVEKSLLSICSIAPFSPGSLDMLHEILFQKFGYMIFGIKKFQGKDVIVFEPFKSDISFYFTKTGIDYSKVVPSGDLDSGVNVIVDKLGSFNVGIQRIVINSCFFFVEIDKRA